MEVLKGNWRLGHMFFVSILLQKLKYVKSGNSNLYFSEHMWMRYKR